MTDASSVWRRLRLASAAGYVEARMTLDETGSPGTRPRLMFLHTRSPQQRRRQNADAGQKQADSRQSEPELLVLGGEEENGSASHHQQAKQDNR